MRGRGENNVADYCTQPGFDYVICTFCYFSPVLGPFFLACHTILYDLKRDILLKQKSDEQKKKGFTRENGSLLMGIMSGISFDVIYNVIDQAAV